MSGKVIKVLKTQHVAINAADVARYHEDVQSMAKTLMTRNLDEPWPLPFDELEEKIEKSVKGHIGKKPDEYPRMVLEVTNNKPDPIDVENRIEKINPFGSSLDAVRRARYAACLAMENDVKEVVEKIIAVKSVVKYWRLIDVDRHTPLTIMDVEPDCPDDQDETIANYFDEQVAHDVRHNYEKQMSLLGIEAKIQVVGFNEDGEGIAYEGATS